VVTKKMQIPACGRQARRADENRMGTRRGEQAGKPGMTTKGHSRSLTPFATPSGRPVAVAQASGFGMTWEGAERSGLAGRIVLIYPWRTAGMGMTFKEVRKMALALDGVEESTSYGTAAFKVRGKLIARLKEDGESLVVGTTFEEREEMMRAEPETYYITDHYLKYPWVLVRLSKVHPEAMPDLLKGAVRLAGRSKRTAAQD
jgi:hypothetical protein